MRDLKKLEYGAKLSVLTKLRPHVYDLGEKVGFDCTGTVDEESTLTSYVKNWIRSNNPSKEPTWKNLIWLLIEFNEEQLASYLEHYLTTVPVPTDHQPSIYGEDGKQSLPTL